MASTEEDTTANCTDPSIAFSTTLDTSSSKLDITREELERRQLLHKIELLKLELSQKALVIDTLRTEQTTQIEELRDQLSDVLHQRKMLHMRLKSETHIHEQEVQRLKGLVCDLERQKEEDERKRVEREGECGDVWKVGGWEEAMEAVRSTLHQTPLSEDEYLALRGQHRGGTDRGSCKQSLTDYVCVRLYEITEPLQRSSSQLQSTVEQLTAQLTARDKETSALRETVSTVTSQLQMSKLHSEQLQAQLNQVKAHIEDGNYKITTFNQLARERDVLKTEVEHLRGNVVQLNTVLQRTSDNRDSAQQEVSSLQQKNSLLLQDKEYLSRQVNELGSRAVAAEGREEALTHKLTESQTARERLYQECVQIREKERGESEEKLQRELERLRERYRQELEHTKSYTKELYDRENRAVMESYHRVGEERDRAVAGEREACRKYEQLLQDHHKLQSRMEARVSELQTAVQVKTMECEQQQSGRETEGKHLREARSLADTLQKKVDVLREEVCRVKSESGDSVRVLEARVREQAERLAAYQQIETEMDDVILQAAQAESESDAERVLFSYGFGTNLPTTAKRRAQQSVRLARRVLKLERINSALHKDTAYERERSQKLQEELAESRSLLSQVGQPQSCMVQSLRRSQEEARTHRDRVSALQHELEHVKKENKQLWETRTQLAADLETVLHNRKELSSMKQLLLGLQGDSLSHSHPPALEKETEVNQLTPRPVLFTKQESGYLNRTKL